MAPSCWRIWETLVKRFEGLAFHVVFIYNEERKIYYILLTDIANYGDEVHPNSRLILMACVRF